MFDRRLTLLVVAGAVLLAGCTGTPGAATASPSPSPVTDGTPTDEPGTPATPAFETYVFDHAGFDAPAIDGGITYAAGGEYTTRYYVTTVATRAEATRRFNDTVLERGARDFVANTSFADSFLVVIQSFPASSVPDSRVESVRRAEGTLHVAINDSSRYATADITVETVLLRMAGSPPERVAVTTEEGHAFDTDAGVVTVTPEPTPTPEPRIELPYAAENDSANVADPRDVRVVNAGNHTNGYHLSVVYHETPECRESTPPCGMPARTVEVLDRLGKLPAGEALVIEDAVARTGNYSVTIEAMLPAENGSRRTVTASTVWTIDADAGDLVATITDDDVTLSRAPSESG